MDKRNLDDGFEARRKACDDALQELVSYAKMGFEEHLFSDTRYRSYAVTSIRLPMSTSLSGSCPEPSDYSAFGYEFNLDFLREYANVDDQLRGNTEHKTNMGMFHNPTPPSEVGPTLRTVYDNCKRLVLSLVNELEGVIDIHQANIIPLLTKDGDVYKYKITRKYEDLMLPIHADDNFYRLYAYLTFYLWVQHTLFVYNGHYMLFALGMVCQVHLSGINNLQALLHLCAMASKRCSTFPYSFSKESTRMDLYAETFAPGVYIRYADGTSETEVQKRFRTKLHDQTHMWFEDLLHFRGIAVWNDYTQEYNVTLPNSSRFGRRRKYTVKFGRNRHRNSKKSTPKKKRTSSVKRRKY